MWTPPAEYRGFVARALFYMDVRYDGQEDNTHNLRLGDVLDRDTAGAGTFTFGVLSHLLQWHADHPAQAWELERNDAVCVQQGNRNPFVDKPELVTALYNTSPTSLTTSPSSPTTSPASPIATEATAAKPMPWINEMHYDNAGADAGEFVEVALPLDGPAAAQVSVTLYNGKGKAPYWGPALLSEAPFVRGEVVTFGTDGGGGGVALYSAARSGIQNGGSDGVALAVAGAAIQFLSYEGVIDGGVGGTAAGIVSTDVGVKEGATTAATTSLSLQGRGSGYPAFVWAAGVAATPGARNAGQTIDAPPSSGACLTPESSSPSATTAPSSPPASPQRSSGTKATLAGVGSGGHHYTFTVVVALAVTLVFYVGGLFRYYI
jgi:hypothetical protein